MACVEAGALLPLTANMPLHMVWVIGDRCGNRANERARHTWLVRRSKMTARSKKMAARSRKVGPR